MKRLLCITFLLGFVVVVSAQTNAPARDFGAGFAKFYQLGLPDVTGGTYGRLEFQGDVVGRDFYSGYSGDLQSLGFSGNAWKVKDLGGGTNRYVLDSATVVDALDHKVYEKWVKHREEELAKATPTQRLEMVERDVPACTVAKWREVDLKKDVTRLLARLEKTDENTTSRIENDTSIGVQLILSAAQLYRLGMTNEANTIAARLFAVHTDPRTLLQEAVSCLANTQYQQAYSSFCDSRDWAAWHRSLTELLGRFPSGWRQAKGVKKLAGMVKDRAANPEPPVPQGEGLTDEDLRLARRLAVDPPEGDVFARPDQGCWVLPQQQFVRPGVNAGTNGVLAAIAARGMKSVPLLIALLKDNTLVQPDRNMEAGVAWQDGDPDEETAQAVLNSLERPRTRGGIARSMLSPLLIRDDQQRDEVYSMRVDAFSAECEAWYKEHRDKATPDLAKIYLEKGDQNQRQYALNYLMQGKDLDANRADIERMLMDIARESKDTPYILQQYVQRRRDKASNFVEQVAVVMLGTNTPPTTVSLHGRRPPSRRQMSDSRDLEFVKQLREMVAVRPVRVLLAEYMSATQSVAKVYEQLEGQITHEDPYASLSAILETAGRIDDPRRRVNLLGLAGRLRHVPPGGVDQFGPGTVDPQTGEPLATKFDPAQNAALWRKLLEDQRGENPPVNVAVAWAIELMYGDEKNSQTFGESWGDGCSHEPDPFDMTYDREPSRTLQTVVDFLGERGKALLLERANSLLAGKPVPELPSGEKVDAGQREKLLQTIVSASDVASELAKLTLDQQLALGEMGMSNRVLNAKLRPIADRIVEVRVRGDFRSAAGLEAKLKGRNFDRDTVKTMLDISRQLAKDGVAFTLAMTRRPNLAGMEVSLSPLIGNVDDGWDSAARIKAAGTNRQEIATVAVMAYGGTRSTSAWWPVKESESTPKKGADPKETEKAELPTRMMDGMETDLRVIAERQKRNAQEGFWEEFGLIVEKVGAYAPAGVSFQGKGAAVVEIEGR